MICLHKIEQQDATTLTQPRCLNSRPLIDSKMVLSQVAKHSSGNIAM